MNIMRSTGKRFYLGDDLRPTDSRPERDGPGEEE